MSSVPGTRRSWATVLLVAVMAAACTSTPPEQERLRVQPMEDAVTPMAATALEAGQLETARRLYRRLMEVDATSVEARMGLGHVAMHEGDPGSAARWYATAFAIARMPRERHAARLAHGRAALADGQLEEAGESFRSLIDSTSRVPRKTVAWAYNGVGLTLLLEGDLRGAVEAMEQAALRAPGETKIHDNHRRVLAMLGDSPLLDEYEEIFEEPGMVSEEADPELDADRPERVGPSGSTERPLHSPPWSANEPGSGIEVAERSPERQAGLPRPQHGRAGTNATETREDDPGADETTDSEKPPDSASRHGPVRIESRTAAIGATGDARISGVGAKEAPQTEEYVETTSPGDASSHPSGAKKIELRRAGAAQVAPPDSSGEATAQADPDETAEEVVPQSSATGASGDLGDGSALAEPPRDGPRPVEEALPEQSAWESLPGIRALTVEEPLRVWNRGNLYLQAASFLSRGQADALASKLSGLTDRPVHISESPSPRTVECVTGCVSAPFRRTNQSTASSTSATSARQCRNDRCSSETERSEVKP